MVGMTRADAQNSNLNLGGLGFVPQLSAQEMLLVACLGMPFALRKELVLFHRTFMTAKVIYSFDAQACTTKSKIAYHTLNEKKN